MRVLLNEPLAKHGFWRVGGPLERFVIAESVEELRALPAIDHVIGNGSNLLVPDAGLRGTTVRLGGALRDVMVLAESGDEVTLRVGGGLLNAVLLQRMEKLGLGGLGCLAGVPGTMGGAVAMNAGTALGEIAACLLAVHGLHGERLSRADLPMRYREGGLPEGFVVVAADLRCTRAGVGEERAKIAEHLLRRKATQPLDLPSCGSVFRNPPGDYAGRLIESCGLKGWRHGGASISDKHGNFIVNLGGATAADVMTCIRTAWDTVRREHGVHLIPEVHVLGEWPEGVWPLPE